ncbi:MAG: zinc-dependent metalloprotease [Planctomycetota bacterium]
MRRKDWKKPLAWSAGALAMAAGLTAAQMNEPGSPDAAPATVPVSGTLDENGNVSLDIGEGEVSFDLGDIAGAFMRGGNAPSSSSRGGLPSFSKVSEGYRKVVSTVDGGSLLGLWVRDKDGQVLAELPRGYERQRHFIAMTVASGDLFAGLQQGDAYVRWEKYDDRIAIISPQLATRSTGDRASKDSVERLFTDRVLADVPIVATGPNGQPVIDLDALLVNQASRFFGRSASGANTRLVKVKTAKAFPENVEIAFEMPVQGGQFRTFHYSISLIPERTGYKPREADQRVGYFTTVYRDLGKFDEDEKWVRYINRWNLQKADRSLTLSPPKEPIVFYVEHTVPVRYRRFVRDGILQWNEAFRRVGIDNAIEVYQQDASTGAHMEKDPEDRRYNFVRWLANDIGTAIGPSRVDPRTGQILDADVILTDGWIRAFWYQYTKTLPDIAMEGFGPDTLAWLNENPRWDPRIRMASPSERPVMMAERARRGVQAYGGHPIAAADSTMLGDDEYDGLTGTLVQRNGLCMAATAKGMDLAVARMLLEMGDLERPASRTAGTSEPDQETIDKIKKLIESGIFPADAIPDEFKAMLGSSEEAETPAEPAAAEEEAAEETEAEPEQAEPEADKIDGVPEWFIGPALGELVAHEIGHTLGLRHNFAASAIYTLEEMNSEEIKGVKPISTSVMDYLPANIRVESGEVQGDYSAISIGDYDKWAIEYGYALSDKDARKVFERMDEPYTRYATDEDTMGPDPLARRYDLSADPIDYAREQIKLAEMLRSDVLNRYVEDGDSWSKARQGYQITLGMQTRASSMMANWLGGAFVYRDKKGDAGDRAPIEVVQADKQREALNFVIEHTFNDEAYGLTPELLKFLTVDKWLDDGGFRTAMQDAAWPVHDRILGVQASALTMLMNPTTLQRVYDNEFRVASDEDALTLPELLETVTSSIWTELDSATPRKSYTSREPMISSLRRNLQREHLERLIDLGLTEDTFTAAYKPISDLARLHLSELGDKAKDKLNKDMDPYTRAHLKQVSDRIAAALSAEYIANTDSMGGGGVTQILMLGNEPE